MSKTTPKPDPLWVTRTQAAEICGVADRTFHEAIRPRLPAAGTRGKGALLRLHAPTVVAVLVAYRVEQAKPAPRSGDDAELMEGGGDSPNLERFRGIKADLAALDLAERRKTLVRAEDVRRALMSGIVALRGTGDRLARGHGNAAADLFNEGVDEFEVQAKRALDDGSGDQ